MAGHRAYWSTLCPARSRFHGFSGDTGSAPDFPQARPLKSELVHRTFEDQYVLSGQRFDGLGQPKAFGLELCLHFGDTHLVLG